MSRYDAVVVGSGPNGLAAAITLARQGRSVAVLEANKTIGGAVRSAELTEPGFIHDIGSAIHPLGRASPFFASLDLESHGLRWITPEAAVAHPLDGGRAAVVWNNIDRAARGLGEDEHAYLRFFRYWVENFSDLVEFALSPVLQIPHRPLLAARFGAIAGLPAAMTARGVWRTDEARALFAGHAAHSMMPLTAPLTTSFGMLLGSAPHTVGWPFPEGGAQSLTDALVSVLTELGGEVRVEHPVRSLADIPDATAVIFALGPHQVESIVGDEFPDRYRRALRAFRYGPGAWKVDFALSEPIPWANSDIAAAGTVHLGGTIDEIVEAEGLTARNKHADKPFVLLAQQTLADPSRAPAGKHTAWAYCHVPNGSAIDRTAAIEAQIERFAPGFHDVVIASRSTSPADLEAQNHSLVGGDVGGGSHRRLQLVFRPRVQLSPYDTANDRFFIGSASTAPGGGVHGMGGVGAAERALATILR